MSDAARKAANGWTSAEVETKRTWDKRELLAHVIQQAIDAETVRLQAENEKWVIIVKGLRDEKKRFIKTIIQARMDLAEISDIYANGIKRR